MSEKATTKPSSAAPVSRSLAAVIAIVIVFCIVVAINAIAGFLNGRADLTQDHLYTLADGTKKILGRLEAPVTVRLYTTDSKEFMTPSELSMSRRVEELIREYVKNSKGKLTFKKLNPEPDTDAEDSAVLDGVQAGASRESGQEITMGIAVECLDAKEVIPFVPARPETMLEYDLSRAIAAVHDGKKSKIVVMTSMAVGGGPPTNFQAPPPQPWVAYSELEKDYQVETIPGTSTVIPEGTDLLVVLHPYDITDEGQYAIDQYLLKGGRVITAVDPMLFASRFMAAGNPMMGGAPGPPPSSNLAKLFSAWGIGYDDTRVVADSRYPTQIRDGVAPTVLSLSREALNKDDVVTQYLNDLFLITPGAFTVTAPDGVTATTLASTSKDIQLVATFDADPTQKEAIQRIRENFKSLNESRVLAVKLKGNFKSAFPDGKPKSAADADKKDEDKKDGEKDDKKDADKPKEEEKDTSLKQSEKEGVVIAIADSDFLYDEFAVQKMQVMNQVIIQPMNGNLTAFQNMVEQLSGASELSDIRSRSSVRRPFTKLNEWLKEAESKHMAEYKKFDSQKREAEQEINNILAAKPGDIKEAIMSPEVQQKVEQLRKDMVDYSKKAREINKQIKKDFDWRQNVIKLGNAVTMPLLVIAFGIGLYFFRRSQTAAR